MPSLTHPTDLTDGVVRLRAFCLADVDDLCTMLADPYIRHTNRAPGVERGSVIDWVDACSRRALAGEAIEFAVERCDDGVLVGRRGLTDIDWGRAAAQIGGWVAPAWRDGDIEERSARLLCAWAFTALDLQRIELRCDEDDLPPQKIADSCGFQFEGVLRSYETRHGQRVDKMIYSLLPGDPMTSAGAYV